MLCIIFCKNCPVCTATDLRKEIRIFVDRVSRVGGGGAGHLKRKVDRSGNNRWDCGGGGISTRLEGEGGNVSELGSMMFVRQHG